MLKLGEKIEDVVRDPAMTVDRTSQRGTGPKTSLRFLGSMVESESRRDPGPSTGAGTGAYVGIWPLDKAQ